MLNIAPTEASDKVERKNLGVWMTSGICSDAARKLTPDSPKLLLQHSGFENINPLSN